MQIHRLKHLLPIGSKISFFLPQLGSGGAQKVLVDLANEMANRGDQVDIVLVKAEGRRIVSVSQNIRIVDLKCRHTILAIPKLRKYILNVKPSLIISSTEIANSALSIVKQFTYSDTKYILRISNILSLVYNGTNIINSLFIRFSSKKFYRVADRIVAVSKGVQKDAYQVTKYDQEIEVIYNPVINSDFYQLGKEKPTHSWLVEKKYKVILAVGRFWDQKDYPTLIKAFKIVKDKMNARLIILGEGPKKTKIERIVKETGLSNWVDMPGFVANPLPFFINSDVYVLSSLYEGLSNSLVQAVACECPVVSTNCETNASEVIKDGHNGKLVGAGDYRDMAEKIIQILKGKFELKHSNSLGKFTMDVAFKKYMKLFQEELLGGHD